MRKVFYAIIIPKINIAKNDYIFVLDNLGFKLNNKKYVTRSYIYQKL